MTSISEARHPARSRGSGRALAAALALALGLPAGLGSAAAVADEAEPEPLAWAEVGFTELDGGANHTLAIGEDGLAYAWGFNGQGRVGDGTTEARLSPVPVDAGDLRFTRVSAGNAHSLALTTAGTVYAWGAGTQGKLGDGTLNDHLSAAPASALPASETFVDVAAGKFHSLALTADGDIYGWGANSRGQLGHGSTVSDVPQPVKATRPAGVKFVSVSGGEQHSVALGDNGTVYAWGYNSSGQLGTGDNVSVSEPVPVVFPDGLLSGAKIVAVAAAESSFTVARADDGSVYAWGANANGQLGNGETANSAVPVRVRAPEGVAFTDVDAGRNWVLARAADGRVFAWGNNRYGQFGTGEGGTGVTSPIPVQVTEPAGVDLAVTTAGANHGLAIGDDGRSYAWGSSSSYLGNGTSSDSFLPVAITPPVAYAPSGIPELGSAELSGTSLAVSWSPVPADGYRVRLRPETGADVFRDVPGETSAVIDGLVPGTGYEVSVAATNWVGAGRYSAASTVRVPAVQTRVTGTAKSTVYGRSGSLSVAVSPAGATGTVRAVVRGKTLSARVSRGSATIPIPAGALPAGRHTLPLAFVPADGTHRPASGTVVATVSKAKPASISVSGPRFRKGAKPKVTVRVGKLPSGASPSGRVRVVVGSSSKTVTLAKRYRSSISVRATFLPRDTANVAEVRSTGVRIRVR